MAGQAVTVFRQRESRAEAAAKEYGNRFFYQRTGWPELFCSAGKGWYQFVIRLALSLGKIMLPRKAGSRLC